MVLRRCCPARARCAAEPFSLMWCYAVLLAIGLQFPFLPNTALPPWLSGRRFGRRSLRVHACGVGRALGARSHGGKLPRRVACNCRCRWCFHVPARRRSVRRLRSLLRWRTCFLRQRGRLSASSRCFRASASRTRTRKKPALTIATLLASKEQQGRDASPHKVVGGSVVFAGGLMETHASGSG